MSEMENAAAPGENNEEEKQEDIDNLSGDGGDDGEDGEGKQEYVKKEYIARPYESTSGVLEEVENSIIKNSRPRL
jgi:hypothetical protein